MGLSQFMVCEALPATLEGGRSTWFFSKAERHVRVGADLIVDESRVCGM